MSSRRFIRPYRAIVLSTSLVTVLTDVDTKESKKVINTKQPMIRILRLKYNKIEPIKQKSFFTDYCIY